MTDSQFGIRVLRAAARAHRTKNPAGSNFLAGLVFYSRLRWILPLIVLGRLSLNTTTRGYL